MREMPIVPGLEAAKVQAAPTPQAKSTSPIAFEALLERLRAQARTLEETAKEPLNAQELHGAVDAAQASLRDALTIADGLLESYRSKLLNEHFLPVDPSHAPRHA